MLKHLCLGLLLTCSLIAQTPPDLGTSPSTANPAEIPNIPAKPAITLHTEEEAETTVAQPVETTITPAIEEAPALPEAALLRRKVEAINFNFKGPKVVSQEFLRSHVELKPNDAFTQAAIDRSIKTLFNTGFFENVYATPVETAPGRMTISFELTGKMKIRTINFEGNKHIKSKKLKSESGLKENEMLGSENLAEAVRKIKTYYGKKNFPDVKIVTRTTPLDNAGLADVTFVIDEGAKVKVEVINFTGNNSIKAKDLRKVIVTKKSSIFSFFTGTGKFDEYNTDEDLARIGEHYRNEGFLEVKVKGPTITPRDGGIELTYHISEGKRFYMGTQAVEGNTLFSTQQIEKAFKLKAGQAFNPSLVDATTAAIRDLYGSKGYLETGTHTDITASTNPTVLNVKYGIKESKQYTVGTINIEGNTTTKNVVIARELLLAPGDVFSTNKMKVSEARLQNTGYFANEPENRVKLSAVPSENPDQQNLNVAVTEGKTGNLSFGAGYGSLDKATIFGEFSQGNFDITNPKNFFRGGGQKLRLYASLGSQSNQMILNFEEPWLLQYPVAGGFSLYRTETDYLSTVYNERRTGFEVYLRKRLVELIDGRLGYRRENVTIFDIEDDASPVIQAEEGTRSVSKVTMEFTRDTRDKVLFSTKGNRLELDTAWAGNGLGGDTDYWSVEARGAQYFHSFEWPAPQYITLLGRVGTMDSFGGDTVPLFDRFFLGGPNTLRGFGYRKVGPKDVTDEPLGGKTYGFWSFEYAFQVADPFQIAFFYDGGFLNSATADFSTSGYADNVGIGVRVLLMGAPLRIDYGIPLTAQGESKSGHFWFSFGTRF